MDIKNEFSNAVRTDLKKNPKLSSAYSWPVIIIVLIIFWPVGIYLMYKRFSLDKSATLKNSKTVAIISYILMALGVIYLIMGLTGQLNTTDGSSPVGSTILLTLLFGGGGIYLFFVSKRMKRNGEKYKHYINLIVNQQQTSIDNIAAAVGVSYDDAKKDLQKMIDCGYFSGAYIHEGNREFVMEQKQPKAEVNSGSAQTKVVVCKSCGANNTVIIGKTCECEYCGSPIQ